MTGRLDDSASQLADFEDLVIWLHEHYEVVDHIEDFDIWRLKNSVD